MARGRRALAQKSSLLQHHVCRGRFCPGGRRRGLSGSVLQSRDGLDHVHGERGGEDIGAMAARHNREFATSYARWFEALYRDKYEYVGEYDLLRLAFLLDLGLYYLGVASQPFKLGPPSLCAPVFTSPFSTPFYQFMRTYNRRFARMARVRRERGRLGRRNAHRRFMFKGYTFARSSVLPLLGALLGWLWLEVREGWRSWGRRPATGEVPGPLLLPVPGATPQ